MAPRRARKKSSTKEPPAKRPKKAKLNALHETISTDTDALQDHVDRGTVSTTVWPSLLKSVDESGCRALVLLVSAACAEGSFAGQASTASPVAFLQNDAERVEGILAVLTSIPFEVDFGTALVHFFTICFANFVGPAWLKHKELLVRNLSGIALLKSMPSRILELALKQYSDEIVDEYSKLPEKESVWIVTLLSKVLDLVKNSLFVEVEHADNDQDGDSSEEEETQQQEKNESKEAAMVVSATVLTFLHRSLELLIDLLSNMETRGYLVTFMNAIHFSLRLKEGLPKKVEHHGVVLLKQLLDRLETVLHFPIHGILQVPLTREQVVHLHFSRATMLQKMCHKYLETKKVAEIIYSSVAMVCRSDFLQNASLSTQDIMELLWRMRLVQDKSTFQGLAFDILKQFVVIPPHAVDQLANLPLYPNEALLWNFHRVPPNHVNGEAILALPKCNTSFLSFDDYLLRNFEWMQLSSAYDIREDLTRVLARVRPVLRQEYEDDSARLVTRFDGWSRMALELESPPDILVVDQPKLGQMLPSRVVAEFMIDVQHCGPDLRKEWDSLVEYDVLFLMAVDASRATHEPPTSTAGVVVADEDDAGFCQRYGVTAVRGCMVRHVRDEEGNVLSDPAAKYEVSSKASEPKSDEVSTRRILRVELDPAQYVRDTKTKDGLQIYSSMNLVVRRHARENNFKAVLETIRGLMQGSGSIPRALPSWLHSVLLGTGDVNDAHYKSDAIKLFASHTVGVTKPDTALDYGDTFLDEDHLQASFPGSEIVLNESNDRSRQNYKVRIHLEKKGDEEKQIVEATPYTFPKGVSGNPVRFTPIQVEAVRSGLSPGLTLVVGPPGTGKTDVAVQIIANLYHSFPTQRTVIATHSNAALNDLFEKVMARGDIKERYMIRLGSGERDLKTSSTHDFTRVGRVEQSLAKRNLLLNEVQLLSETLGISGKAERGADGSPSYTCETAGYFNLHHVETRIEKFREGCKEDSSEERVFESFPFKPYFGLHEKEEKSMSMEDANAYFAQLQDIFDELEEYRPLEIFRTLRQRTDYLLMKQAKIVAMTCTHAAIVRSRLIDLGFQYDNIVVEEAGQMMEVETFVPLLLQRGDESTPSRLKRICLIGDHQQLPPVVKNHSLARYCNLDQSLFTRLIRLEYPYIQLDRQGRAREDIARLYSWRYENLGNLVNVLDSPAFQLANSGFQHTYQMINVDDFEGRGETSPTPSYYQNLGEAEYAVALFQYMVLIGYPPDRISILTTYNGQKDLLIDICNQRCGQSTPFAGIRPGAISTVDQYQGQQNDFVLLSLVRTKAVGHLRDVRRLVVAVSRARLGLYVFCRQALFADCHSLHETMEQFAQRPHKLQLVLGEHYPTERRLTEQIPKDKLFEVEDVSHLGSMVHSMQQDWIPEGQ